MWDFVLHPTLFLVVGAVNGSGISVGVVIFAAAVVGVVKRYSVNFLAEELFVGKVKVKQRVARRSFQLAIVVE